MKNSEP